MAVQNKRDTAKFINKCCPKCGSVDIDYGYSTMNDSWSKVFVCLNCEREWK